jgi:uncharacterized protein YndB with AHSA1/START domain
MLTETRRVGALDITLPSPTEIRFVRAFKAPARLVFDAYTIPALLKRWLLGPDGWTMPVCDIDLRPGGHFRYVWRHESGVAMGMKGTYVDIDAPRLITHTELFDEDWTGGETHVRQDFAEADGMTTVTQIVRYASEAARDGALKTPMAEGMEAGFARLEALLANQE